MIRFLDLSAIAALIRVVGIENILAQLADYIAADYRRWEEFEKCPRHASHSTLGVIELMPISDKKLYSFKYVNGHPGNTNKGLPNIVAFGVLADVETGIPLLLSEFTVATALRTAATSALAAKNMARAESKTMAVIGCGAQSEFQILAFKRINSIKEVRVYDINRAVIDKLCRNLTQAGIEIKIATSTAEAVKGADIITTLTAAKTKTAILVPKMIEAGMHLNAVGGDCPGKTELHVDIVRTARVVVEYAPQTRIEGEIQQMPADFPVIELWELLTKAKTARDNDKQVTLFDAVGFALEDFATLRYLNDMALKHNIGTHIGLIPTFRDPRDLYSLIA